MLFDKDWSIASIAETLLLSEDAIRERQIEESVALGLSEEHHCPKARATRKIDLAKPQQAKCHPFGARVNNGLIFVWFLEEYLLKLELCELLTEELELPLLDLS